MSFSDFTILPLKIDLTNKTMREKKFTQNKVFYCLNDIQQEIFDWATENLPSGVKIDDHLLIFSVDIHNPESRLHFKCIL